MPELEKSTVRPPPPLSLPTAMAELENVNPLVKTKLDERGSSNSDWDDDVYDPFDAREIFDLIRHIRDPEHPLSLEELNVVSGL